MERIGAVSTGTFRHQVRPGNSPSENGSWERACPAHTLIYKGSPARRGDNTLPGMRVYVIIRPPPFEARPRRGQEPASLLQVRSCWVRSQISRLRTDDSGKCATQQLNIFKKLLVAGLKILRKDRLRIFLRSRTTCISSLSPGCNTGESSLPCRKPERKIPCGLRNYSSLSSG